MSHRADATACGKRMKEGCPSLGSVPFAVFKCKVTKDFWNEQEKREVSFLKPLFTLGWTWATGSGMFRNRPCRRDRWWCRWNTDDRQFTSWTDLQDVVPARALISSRTPRANADALSNRQRSLSFRHSPACDNRSVWSPFILRFYFWWQRYDIYL